MVSVINILLIVVFCAIAWQDWKSRMVSLWLVLGGIALQAVVWHYSSFVSIQELQKGFGLLLMTCSMVGGYAWIRFGSGVHRTVGLGDILVVSLIPLAFAPVSGLIFLGGSAIAGALYAYLFGRRSIPFCSFLSAGMVMVITTRYMIPDFGW